MHAFMDNDTLKQLYPTPFKEYKHEPSAQNCFKL